MRVDATTRALVTGASKGIGKAIADASEGRHPLPCDVGDAASITAAVDRFVAEVGGLDLVVANAGIAHYGPFAEQDPALHERMAQVNFLGTVNTVRASAAAHAARPHRDRLLRGRAARVPTGRRLRRHQGGPAGLRTVNDAIEKDRRSVAYPRQVALLRLNATAPRAVDALLRRLRGDSAAPRR